MKKKDEKRYDRRAVYTGRRLGGGKIFHEFELLPERKKMYFQGIRRVFIGYAYKCTAGRMPEKPEIDYEIKREDNPKWDADDALVDATNAAKRAEKKYREAASPALKKALEALIPLVKGKNVFEREALLKYLLDKTRG